MTTATVGPLLVAAMGLPRWSRPRALNTAQRTPRRWIGTVALLGALAFLNTFFTLIDGPTEDSVLGYRFLVGFLALAIWSIAASIATYRAVATTAGDLVTAQTDS